MMSLSEAEAETINYLYKHNQRLHYAAEIARELNKVPRTSVYRGLKSLEKKGIVEKEKYGKMNLYKLVDDWKGIVEMVMKIKGLE